MSDEIKIDLDELQKFGTDPSLCPASYEQPSNWPIYLTAGALACAFVAFVWMAWRFDLLRKSIPEFVTE